MCEHAARYTGFSVHSVTAIVVEDEDMVSLSSVEENCHTGIEKLRGKKKLNCLYVNS